jgi:hypothetical protein
MSRDWHDEAAALWLAPFIAAIPLAVTMSIRSSPVFLGKLIGEPSHPFNWPHLGQLQSAMAVFFDAEILGVLTLLFFLGPAYAGLRATGKNTAVNTLILCAVAGVAASQVAHLIAQGFRQAELRAFAGSDMAPILGCVCGLAAGGAIVHFANRRIARAAVCCLPVVAMGVSATLLVWSGGVYRGH